MDEQLVAGDNRTRGTRQLGRKRLLLWHLPQLFPGHFVNGQEKVIDEIPAVKNDFVTHNHRRRRVASVRLRQRHLAFPELFASCIKTDESKRTEVGNDSIAIRSRRAAGRIKCRVAFFRLVGWHFSLPTDLSTGASNTNDRQLLFRLLKGRQEYRVAGDTG